VDGIPANNQVYDVTDGVKAKIASGAFEFQVNDNIAAGKPKIETTKALRVSYSIKSGERTVTVPYGNVMKFTQELPQSALISKNEKYLWRTPYPGVMTYTTSLGKTKKAKAKSVPKPLVLSGAWELDFPNIEKVSFPNLISWAESTDENIRYFSGTASYKKEFVVTKAMLKGDNSLEIDLSSVKEIAEVFVNGQSLGVLWKAPYRTNIDHAVKQGINTLEVRVTNLWPNRLIGDEQLPLDYVRKGPNIAEWPDWILNKTERPTNRVTLPAFRHWNKDSELLPSGLLGPVKLIVYKKVELK
jgi:hypothetical protein